MYVAMVKPHHQVDNDKVTTIMPYHSVDNDYVTIVIITILLAMQAKKTIYPGINFYSSAAYYQNTYLTV